MLALEYAFPDVAAKDAYGVEVAERDGTTRMYAFRELYCEEPGCDCRRVVVEMVSDGHVVAAIHYAFDAPARRAGPPRVSLDRLGPQGAKARVALGLFQHVIATDAGYRATLLEHYAMWRRVVDERAAAAQRPKPSSSVELITAKAGPRTGSKQQQRFRTVLRRIEKLRRRLELWRSADPAIQRELAQYRAAFQRRTELDRELAVLLDANHARLTRAERAQASIIICELLEELLHLPGDPYAELKPLYNRHSGGDFDDEVAEDNSATAAMLRGMFETMGIDTRNAKLETVDDIAAFAAEQHRQHAEADDARRAKRKKSARQLAAEAEHQDAHRSVQEVYRALARAFHPDREPDPVERERKTRLMAEVNVAYESRDLLRLLELQLELERVDPDSAQHIADDRLRHYNRVLDEQARQLADEVATVEAPFRHQLQLAPQARLEPSHVLYDLRRDREELELDNAGCARTLEQLAHLPSLKTWLVPSKPKPRSRPKRSSAVTLR
jgi:hypothetical protein